MPPRKRDTTTTVAKEFIADEGKTASEPDDVPTTPSGVTSPDTLLRQMADDLDAMREQLSAVTQASNGLADRVGNIDINAVSQRVRENENLLSTFIESVGKHQDSVSERFNWITNRLPADTATSRPAILGAIQGVMNDVTGVGKHGQMDAAARMGNYKYQRYDDLKRELGAAFRKHGVFLQSTSETLVNERVGEAGRMTRVVVAITYRFTSLLDGSELTFDSHGESIDKSDKATSKAMTMALKTALLQAFMLAAEDTEDPDASRPREDDVPQVNRPGSAHKVGDTVTVGDQTFVKHSDGPAYPNAAPKDQADPWDQGPPKDTRTPQEKAQAAVVKLSDPTLTLDAWTAISNYAQQLELLDVEVTTPDGVKVALKHFMLAVSRTL